MWAIFNYSRNTRINTRGLIKMNLYKCKHCGQIVKIKSDKRWIKSYCEESGKNVHLIKISKNTDVNDKKEIKRCDIWGAKAK